MQQDNNIENKLRQLDDEQQPDLGNMDAHWQQMQAMLQPVAVPVKKGLPKWMLNTLSVAAVVILVSAAFFYLSKTKKVNDRVAVPVNEAPVEKSTSATTIVNSSDSAEPVMMVTTAVPDIQYHEQGNGNTDDYNTTDDGPSIFDSMKINFTPCDACPSKKNDSSIVASVNRKMMLEKLFAQLEKEEQVFTIDNSRDTLLQGKEGTALLIPANSFAGKKGIVLTLKEFYKESDIVLNQLSTVSNKDQLISGGMIQIKATLDGNEVAIDSSKPVQLYMNDTSADMNGMQLFNGEENNSASTLGGSTSVNWVPQQQLFSNIRMVSQVRVLNMANMPYNIKEKENGQIGYFLVDDSMTISKDAIKEMLIKKYGYYKVRLRNAEWWEVHNRSWTVYDFFNSYYATKIGDSVWMEKGLADKYKLVGTATRVVPENTAFYRYTSWKNLTSLSFYSGGNKLQADAIKAIQGKYGVNINRLGWINCDRFYKDKREKIQYTVNLGDSAQHYHTMLVFDKIKSVMNGYAVGNKVIFNDIPEGEKVKVVSIGIDKSGNTVYTLQPATTNTQELTGLQFESVSAPDLKAALSKMDK